MASILVVEDNVTNLKLATLVLTNAGHVVYQAADGAAGIDIARRRAPDIILMDVEMAGMDGLTATSILKQDPATAGIPIVAMTAMSMRGDEEKIRAAGCDDYIGKPFRYPFLLRRVQEILERKCAVQPSGGSIAEQ
jgi:two-component system cell cycle response regulator DivK